MDRAIDRVVVVEVLGRCDGGGGVTEEERRRLRGGSVVWVRRGGMLDCWVPQNEIEKFCKLRGERAKISRLVRKGMDYPICKFFKRATGTS